MINRTILNQRHMLTPLVLFFCATAFGQDSPSIQSLRATQLPTSTVGLPIGSHIPDFQAPDQDGNLRDFDSVRGPKGAVFYFHRSADWCIYCRTQLVESEASRETLAENGFGLVGVSFDSSEVLKKFSDEKSIRFPLLSDPQSKLIRDFQVLDATVLPDSPGYGVPYHGTYIINEKGVVVAKLFDAEAVLSHTTGLVVSRFFGSPKNTHEKIVKHDHLSLAYYASANTVSPGDEIELFIDVTLYDSIHVYAPTAAPYIPVDWQLTPQPGVSILPVTYPSATKQLATGPDSKPAPAYTGTFQLTRRIKITDDVKLDPQGNLALKGGLTFQACDAKLCYPPVTIPLEWKLGQKK